MPKMTTIVPAFVATVLLSAMVFASTPTAGTGAEPSKAPNRAMVFADQL